jgi:ATP-dependent helicase/nuclease subunit A
VGDPKQSIYGFRRADARVFYAAKNFICTHLNGTHLACDHTRRNAQQVIGSVNQVMTYLGEQGQYEGFRAHTTASSVAGGVFALLPALDKEASGTSQSAVKAAPVWRDSLRQPRHEPDEDKGMLETRQAAQVVAQWLTQLNPESDPPQPYQAGQVFVLARKRQELQRMAEALDELGIPNACPADTWLMETTEALDVLALLEVLVNPWSDVALARVLRSPMFDVSDEALMAMAVQRKALSARHQGDALPTWWQTLMHMSFSDLAVTDAQAVAAARTALPQWLHLSAVLPPHDLLQQVMADTGWKQTLAKRLPPSKLRQALVCLDAVVSETLQLQGGRDATPATCWQGLKRLRKRLPAEVSQSAVQLLTIHGAKGLEAELVMVLNCDPRANPDSGYELVVDWPVDASVPALCAFVSKLSELPPSLQAIKSSAKQTQQLEECNALYVAMTRAKHALVFSQKPTTGRAQNASDTWWQQLWRSQALSDESVWLMGEQHETQASQTVASNELAVLPALLPKLSRAVVPATVLPSAADDAQALLGQVVHRVLEWATSLSSQHWREDKVRHWVGRAWRQMGAMGTSEQQAVCADRVMQVLHNQALMPWLDPEQSSWSANEYPVFDAGQWRRIDRLVLHDDAAQAHWWVIDYKWHDHPDQVSAYVAQLKQYVALVKQQYPEALVSGAFISGQGQWLALP